MSFVSPCHLNGTNASLAFHFVARIFAKYVLSVGESILFKAGVWTRINLLNYFHLFGSANSKDLLSFEFPVLFSKSSQPFSIY